MFAGNLRSSFKKISMRVSWAGCTDPSLSKITSGYRFSKKIIRTPLEKQVDPSGPIASRGSSIRSFVNYVKPVLSSHSKRRPKFVFKTDSHLMQVESIAECSKGSILQYIRPSLRYHLSIRPLFCLFLSGRSDRFYFDD